VTSCQFGTADVDYSDETNHVGDLAAGTAAAVNDVVPPMLPLLVLLPLMMMPLMMLPLLVLLLPLPLPLLVLLLPLLLLPLLVRRRVIWH
jgi:hypothetical protein